MSKEQKKLPLSLDINKKFTFFKNKINFNLSIIILAFATQQLGKEFINKTKPKSFKILN